MLFSATDSLRWQCGQSISQTGSSTTPSGCFTIAIIISTHYPEAAACCACTGNHPAVGLELKKIAEEADGVL
jgi:hypothetical protein